MNDNISLYPNSNIPLGNTNLYQVTNQKHNIDLRTNLHNLLFGDRAHPGQGKIVLVRSMQTICPCVLEERGQKMREPDPKCSICKGEGYSFKDIPYTTWRSVIHAVSGPSSFEEVLPGIANIVGYNFIFEYNTPIKPIDKILEISLDLAGQVSNGGVIADDKLTYQYKKFKISQLIVYRSDNARVEFLRIIGEEEQW